MFGDSWWETLVGVCALSIHKLVQKPVWSLIDCVSVCTFEYTCKKSNHGVELLATTYIICCIFFTTTLACSIWGSCGCLRSAASQCCEGTVTPRQGRLWGCWQFGEWRVQGWWGFRMYCPPRIPSLFWHSLLPHIIGGLEKSPQSFFLFCDVPALNAKEYCLSWLILLS